MLFCIVRGALTEEIPEIHAAIEDGSMQVFKSGFYQDGTNHPMVVCKNCPILSKHTRGTAVSYRDCRFNDILTKPS